jgi:prepilin-type N-terminal cleavage/methylation domain-containing protein
MKRGKKSAFTLIEVVLASAIFATALVVLTGAFTNALTAMHNMHRDAGDEVIFRYVSSLVTTVPDLDNFKEGEELDLPDDAKVSWTAVVEQTAVADLFKVELTITLRKAGADEPLVRVEHLYLLRPTWSDSDDRDKIISDAKTALNTERGTIQ